MRVAVAGGGIAGLTAAIALAQRGFNVDLYERAPALEEIGAGIQLSPNATRILQRLGVMDGLAGRMCEPEAFVIREARSGATLTTVPLGKGARARYGAPYCTLHRADLQAALLAALRSHPTIALHLGVELREVRAGEAGVSFAAGGVEGEADILVAADGVRSAVRTDYFRHPGPVSLRHCVWRATLPATDFSDRVSPDEVGLWLGAGAHLVHYPISSGSKFNVVLIGGANAEPPIPAFGSTARQVLDSVPDWLQSSLVAVDASRPWKRGRVVLIGDAAHAMAPAAAQGGAQAIEDAEALAASLSSAPTDPLGALAAYEELRRPRVERVAQLSARNLQFYELQGVPALARNLLLRALPASLMQSQLDWLFGLSA